jgi:hypothetical protein
MLNAMTAGEADPKVLAEMARGKMRRKIPELAEALIGNFGTSHALIARAMNIPRFGCHSPMRGADRFHGSTEAVLHWYVEPADVYGAGAWVPTSPNAFAADSCQAAQY